MVEAPGRRERKKAATRTKIADAALRMFTEHGYESVGIRDVAAEADVAVTTLFAHFTSKEALVFEQDADFETRLARSVTERTDDTSLITALRGEIEALVRHCTSDAAAPIWRMIDGSPTLRAYEASMRQRHARALAAALAADLGVPISDITCRTIAQFVVDAHSLARESADPQAAVEDIFEMIEAAWGAASARPNRQDHP